MEEAQLDTPPGAFDIGVNLAITKLIPGGTRRSNNYPIYFLMNDGSRRQLTMNFDMNRE